MPTSLAKRYRLSIYAYEYWSRADGMKGADIAIKWGICTWATKFGGAMDANMPNAPAPFKGKAPMEPGMGWYIKYLYDLGVLGPGKQIESYPLPMKDWSLIQETGKSRKRRGFQEIRGVFRQAHAGLWL